jgi:hypothetical protein
LAWVDLRDPKVMKGDLVALIPPRMMAQGFPEDLGEIEM